MGTHMHAILINLCVSKFSISFLNSAQFWGGQENENSQEGDSVHDLITQTTDNVVFDNN